MPREQQVRALVTRAHLIDVAGKEFAAHGWHGASVMQILSTADASKGALYFHFGSKEELALAVIERAQQTADAICLRWTHRPASPVDALYGMLGELARLYVDQPAYAAPFRLSSEPQFAEVTKGGLGMLRGPIRLLLERGVDDGYLENVNCELLAGAIVVHLSGWMHLDRASLPVGFQSTLDLLVRPRVVCADATHRERIKL